jgi:DNA-binding transcriptional regulator YiaG
VPRYAEPVLDLPSIVLLDAVVVSACMRCGAWASRTVPHLDDLAVAAAVARVLRRERLDGPTIRFLRRQLRLSVGELAEAIGARTEHVARWDAGTSPITESADRLLRVLVVRRLHEPQRPGPVDRRLTPFQVATIPLDPPPPRTAPLAFRLDATGRHWMLDTADRLAPARGTTPGRPTKRA